MFLKGAFGRKSPISTERNGQIMPGKLLNLIRYIGDEIRQFSISLFDIQGAGFFQTPGNFIDSPGIFIELP